MAIQCCAQFVGIYIGSIQPKKHSLMKSLSARWLYFHCSAENLHNLFLGFVNSLEIHLRAKNTNYRLYIKKN